MNMRSAFFPAFVCIVFAGIAKGSEINTEEYFTKAARLEGSAFCVTRDVLVRQGKALLPMLRRKIVSDDWQERDLAGDLILRIEKPDQALLLEEAFSYRSQNVSFGADGAVAVKFDRAAWDDAERLKRPPPSAESVIVTREHVPFILGLLRTAMPDFGNNCGEVKSWPRCLSTLKYFAALECVPAIVEYSEHGRFGSDFVDILVSVGPPACPLLRRVIRDTPTTWSYESGAAAIDVRQQNMAVLQRSVSVALALGKIGDREAIPLVMEKLKTATFGSQLEAYTQALAMLKAVETLPEVFQQCIRVYEIRLNGHSDSLLPEYFPCREAVLSFGDAAKNFLRERARPERSLIERLLATGMLFELENPDVTNKCYIESYGMSKMARDYEVGRAPETESEKIATGKKLFWTYGDDTIPPQALLQERAWILSRAEDFLHLKTDAANPLGFDVLAEGFRRHEWDEHVRSALAMALAQSGNERAVDLYAEAIHSGHANAALLEAILLLGSPTAVPLLENADYKEWSIQNQSDLAKVRDLAREIIICLRGDSKNLIGLLKHERLSVRVVAARVLAQKNELKALDVLIPAGTSARAEEHIKIREAILQLGPAALKVLDERQRNSAEPLERLFCESVALRIRRPELVKQIDSAPIGSSGFVSHAGPGIRAYEHAGEQLAMRVGHDGIPLFEAAIAFQAGPPQMGIALFALATLKEERSIPVIVAAAPALQIYVRRNEAPVAQALARFGVKGIEAAKAVSAPNPDRGDFENRGSRRRIATEVLAITNNAQGIDNILAGLKEPKPEKPDTKWLHRIKTYIRLSHSCHDPRLVDAILGVLENDPENLWEDCVNALAAYDDARVVPTIAKFLGRDTGGTDPAVVALVTRLGNQDIVPFLIKTFQDGDTAVIRTGAVKALGNLAAWPTLYFKIKDEAELKALMTSIRNDATGPLIKALNDSPNKKEFAESLAQIAQTATHGNFDKAAVQALAKSIRTASDPSRVAELLAKSKDPEAGEAILSVYRRDNYKNSQLALLLGELKTPGAIEDVTTALKVRIEKKDWEYGIPEFDALGHFGAPGLERVLAIFRENKTARVRIESMAVFEKQKYREAFPEVKAYCDELIASGSLNPALEARTTYSSAMFVTAQTLLNIDPEHGYTYVCGVLLKIKDPEILDAIGRAVQRIEQERPELKKLPLNVDQSK